MIHHTLHKAHCFFYNIIRSMLCIALLYMLIVLCRGWAEPQAARAQGDMVIVDIMGSAQPPGFVPSLVTVHLYDTVVFINQSQPAVPYAVIADDNSFSSPAITPGQQWSVTVNSPGAFEYHEAATTPRMVGAIVVVDSGTPLLPAPYAAAQATAIGDINAGRMPPDAVWQQGVPQQASQGSRGSPTTATRASSWLFWVSFASTAALVIALEVVVFGLVKGGIVGVRWARTHRKRDEDEDEDEDE